MRLKKFIAITIREFLNESKAGEIYNIEKERKEYAGIKYDVFKYQFTVDGIDFDCAIYPNLWKKNYYDVAFIKSGGTTKDRIGRDFNFMNSVLKTVADCIIDFISKKDVVKIIAFDGDALRIKAYIRFFRNHPYFSKFEIDDSYGRSGFVEIHIDKGVEE